MASSPPTTPASDLCANGCGRPQAFVGGGAYTVKHRLCDACLEEESAVLEQERLEQDRLEAVPAALKQLDLQLGPRFSRRTLDGFPAGGGRTDAVAKASAWLTGFLAGERPNLYLCGPVGEGKTGIAVALARAVAAKGTATRFYVAHEWVELVRRARSRDGAADVDHELRARQAPLLVLDDLAASDWTTPFALERLLGLVDDRYRFERPTIVTSNHTPAELVLALGKEDPTAGKRIVSRLVEDAVLLSLKFGNLRLEQREAPAA